MVTMDALAKIVADILSQHGLDVRGPEDGELDEVEQARWAVCQEIVQEIVRALQEARSGGSISCPEPSDSLGLALGAQR